LSSDSLKYAGYCIGGLVCLCIFFVLIQTHSHPLQIKPLILHSKQCLDMSRQDKTTMFALQHAVEGLTYIQMSRKLASDSKIQELTQISASDLEEIFLTRIQELHSSGINSPSKTEATTASIIRG
jgi:hypothetical protein